jgi:hypothetical protein
MEYLPSPFLSTMSMLSEVGVTLISPGTSAHRGFFGAPRLSIYNAYSGDLFLSDQHLQDDMKVNNICRHTVSQGTKIPLDSASPSHL